VSGRTGFETTGGMVAFDDLGAGPAVLLLHGFPLHGLAWRAIGPMLATRFRVIVPDLLGAGASAHPQGVTLDARAQAGYLRELLEHLGVSAYAVVGHGSGGAVAQALALEGDGVGALVLIDAPWLGEPVPAMVAAIRTPSDVPSSVVRGLLAAGGVPGGSIADELVEAYAGPFLDDPGALGRAAGVIGAGSVVPPDAWSGVDYPVLLLWGEEDPLVPVAVADRLNEAIASSTLGLVPGCGHFLTEEAPDTIAPLIHEYLRALYLRAPHGHADEKAGAVMLQLERRPPWVDLEEDEADDWFVDDDDAGGGGSP
jgi:pimeloyl-ACP methyl ester carboxylesterase